MDQFRADRQPLRLYEDGMPYDGAPLYEVYLAGCQEMTFHLLGSSEVDDSFHSRVEIAEKVTPAQLHAVVGRDGARRRRGSPPTGVAVDPVVHGR